MCSLGRQKIVVPTPGTDFEGDPSRLVSAMQQPALRQHSSAHPQRCPPQVDEVDGWHLQSLGQPVGQICLR